jgi:hypothetical protein
MARRNQGNYTGRTRTIKFPYWKISEDKIKKKRNAPVSGQLAFELI